MLNIRPRGSVTQFFYSPNRDVAHCTPFYLLRAIYGMQKANREPWFAHYMEYSGITDEEVGKTAEAAARYIEITIDRPDVDNSYEALKLAGFFDLPAACQVVLMAKLGQLFFAGYFISKRESTGQTRDEAFDAACIRELVHAAEQQIARCNKFLGRKKIKFLLKLTRDFFSFLWDKCRGLIKAG